MLIRIKHACTSFVHFVVDIAYFIWWLGMIGYACILDGVETTWGRDTVRRQVYIALGAVLEFIWIFCEFISSLVKRRS